MCVALCAYILCMLQACAPYRPLSTAVNTLASSQGPATHTESGQSHTDRIKLLVRLETDKLVCSVVAWMCTCAQTGHMFARLHARMGVLLTGRGQWRVHRILSQLNPCCVIRRPKSDLVLSVSSPAGLISHARTLHSGDPPMRSGRVSAQ